METFTLRLLTVQKFHCQNSTPGREQQRGRWSLPAIYSAARTALTHWPLAKFSSKIRWSCGAALSPRPLISSHFNTVRTVGGRGSICCSPTLSNLPVLAYWPLAYFKMLSHCCSSAAEVWRKSEKFLSQQSFYTRAGQDWDEEPSTLGPNLSSCLFCTMKARKV